MYTYPEELIIAQAQPTAQRPIFKTLNFLQKMPSLSSQGERLAWRRSAVRQAHARARRYVPSARIRTKRLPGAKGA